MVICTLTQVSCGLYRQTDRQTDRQTGHFGYHLCYLCLQSAIQNLLIVPGQWRHKNNSSVGHSRRYILLRWGWGEILENTMWCREQPVSLVSEPPSLVWCSASHEHNSEWLAIVPFNQDLPPKTEQVNSLGWSYLIQVSLYNWWMYNFLVDVVYYKWWQALWLS